MSKLTWDIALVLLLSSLKQKIIYEKWSDFEREMIKYNIHNTKKTVKKW